MTDDLILERTYAAGLARLWDAWTQGRDLEQWYCPNPVAPTTAHLDVRPGGGHVVDMGPFRLAGRYGEVVPQARLTHTWSFDGGRETHLAVDFHEVTGGTQVTLTHSGFADGEEREGIEQGWTITLARLRSLLAEGSAVEQ
jgi:uncharacterized protein YndB with AHSA1/START domain